jgi:hypothetical protein
MTFRIHYTSLFPALPGPSGEGMRPKQGVVIFRLDDALLNLTMAENMQDRKTDLDCGHPANRNGVAAMRRKFE